MLDVCPTSDRDLIRRAVEAFRDVAGVPPPLTLRAGGDLDDYNRPRPFDPAVDAPTDEYLERHAFIGLGYLDAASWRHYLPRLIEYTFSHPDDPAMVIESLVRSLRPPDRYPPRLASLEQDQEDTVRVFLEAMTAWSGSTVQDDAQQALDEWWGPNPRCRPTLAEIQALRSAPTTYRMVTEDGFRLQVPDTCPGSGVRDIPSESRRVQTWGGYVCGDVHAMLAVNVFPGSMRRVDQVVASYASFFAAEAQAVGCAVPGARQATRVDAVVFPNSPADPHALIIIVAEAADVVALTLRAHDRLDVREVMAHIAASFALA
jgi:hypothetical protein